MALGREYIAVASTNGGADVFCLAGFLRDDNLIGHHGLGWKDRFDRSFDRERIVNVVGSQAASSAELGGQTVA